MMEQAVMSVSVTYCGEDITFEEATLFVSGGYSVKVGSEGRDGVFRYFFGYAKELRNGHAVAKAYDKYLHKVRNICQDKEREITHFLLFVEREIFALHGVSDTRCADVLTEACRWFTELIRSDDGEKKPG